VTALRRRLEREGLVILEERLDAERIARLKSAVDCVWRTRGDGSALHLLGFVGLDESFVELVDHPAALTLVCEVLGSNVFVYHCHLDVHPPLERSPAPAWRWHQDGGRQNVELAAPRPQLSLKVAYFLTDVDEPEHGAMWLIRGSHRRDRLERPRNGSVRPPDTEPLLVLAGTVVIFDRRLWHARGDNVAGRTRKSSSTRTPTAGSGRATSSWAWTTSSWRRRTRCGDSYLAPARAQAGTGSQPTTMCPSRCVRG
jgi:ectoine hydroxylase